MSTCYWFGWYGACIVSAYRSEYDGDRDTQSSR